MRTFLASFGKMYFVYCHLFDCFFLFFGIVYDLKCRYLCTLLSSSRYIWIVSKCHSIFGYMKTIAKYRVKFKDYTVFICLVFNFNNFLFLLSFIYHNILSTRKYHISSILAYTHLNTIARRQSFHCYTSSIIKKWKKKSFFSKVSFALVLNLKISTYNLLFFIMSSSFTCSFACNPQYIQLLNHQILCSREKSLIVLSLFVSFHQLWKSICWED